jgi:catechol 2,3-dioxygenase-like lactoylglutathione lyase family enzyme
MRLHHVQLACPEGGEEGARAFWVQALGFTEVEKPPALRSRGGAWFRAYDDHGAVCAEVHVGVEAPFVPARKAHPAVLLADRDELESVGARLEGLGLEVDHSQRDTFPGHLRLHAFDPHGNRVELLAEVGEPVLRDGRDIPGGV